MIIVEGPDGSGKDTLIANLGYESKKLKALRGGVGGTVNYTAGNGIGDGLAGWGGDHPALLAYTHQVMKARGTKTAFNRFHLSEVVYGPILRGKQELSPADLRFLDGLLRTLDATVILCLPPFEVTLANVRKPGRERPAYQTDEFLSRAYVEFDMLKKWATIVYDFTRDPVPQLIAPCGLKHDGPCNVACGY
jgi:thymidylate kinase